MTRTSRRSRPKSGAEPSANPSGRDRGPGWEPEGGVPRYITFPAQTGGGWVPSLGSIVAGSVLMMTSYFVAEAVLAANPHSLHWLAAVVGGLVGGVGPIIAVRVFGRSR